VIPHRFRRVDLVERPECVDNALVLGQYLLVAMWHAEYRAHPHTDLAIAKALVKVCEDCIPGCVHNRSVELAIKLDEFIRIICVAPLFSHDEVQAVR
jgi:hypothetical protein